MRPLGVLCCVGGVLGHLAPVHRCACLTCCFACAVSWASWLVFTGVPARCVVLRVRCPGPLSSCSPVCPLAMLCCVGGVLGHLAPVHRCARSVCCFACAVSWASWLLFTRVLAWCVVSPVRCPGPIGSCSPVCPLGVLCCVCGVLGHLAPVHWCARWVCCVAWAVSWATLLLFTGVPARCVALRVRCPGPLGSCSPVCSLGVLCCVCGVLGHLAPVHRCARWVCCVAPAVSWATWLLFRLTVHHISGIKNELSDYISRNNFDALIGESSEALAKEAFKRMDVQLDLSMRTDGILEGWSLTDYQSEYKEILETLSTGVETRVIDGHQWYKINQYLFYEDRIVVPEAGWMGA